MHERRRLILAAAAAMTIALPICHAPIQIAVAQTTVAQTAVAQTAPPPSETTAQPAAAATPPDATSPGGRPPATPSPDAATPDPNTPAATATLRALDPAAVLTAPTSTQIERDEAARRLLLRHDDASRQTLLATLQDRDSQSGQRAVAHALQTDPAPDKIYVGPLFTLVGTGKDNTDAAIGALANYHNDRGVMDRLIDFATDANHAQKLETRIAAIKAIAGMTDKTAVYALLTLVTADPTPQIRAASAQSLTKMTGVSAGQDAAQWQKWWNDNRNKPDAAFEHDLLDARSVRLSLLEQRFDRVVTESQSLLAESYQSASENSREKILLRYLRASEPETRLVGVRLIQDDFNLVRTRTPTVTEQLRTMVGDSSPLVRQSVAKTLSLINDPGAVAAILDQIKQEPDAEVRAALVETLAPTQDPRVIVPLLDRLHDPSLRVAEAAAGGLQLLGPQIGKDPALTQRVSKELRDVLKTRAAEPGSTPFRAAVVDAMGMLHDPELRMIYPRLLGPSEPVVVRRAALRALGKINESWAADNIANSLDDADDSIRLEAVNALDTTADFAQAEKLYSLLTNAREKPEIRDRAWAVLKNRFSDRTATNEALFHWADRFTDEPERRIAILEVLQKRFDDSQDGNNLATVRQDIGVEKLKLSDTAARAGDTDTAVARAKDAETSFDLALQYYRTKGVSDQDMVTSAVLEKRMDALLASKQYARAGTFASESIQRYAPNQEAMGRKLRDEIDRLRTSKQYKDALQLIAIVDQMNPKLADQFLNSIKGIESDVKQKMSANPGSQSATSFGQ